MTPDALYTALACTTVASLAALAIVVLPLRQDELTESWLAWSVLARLARRGIARLREARPVVPARPVRSA